MPILNHKVLGQAYSQNSSSNLILLYKVPENTTAEVKTLTVCHTGGGTGANNAAIYSIGVFRKRPLENGYVYSTSTQTVGGIVYLDKPDAGIGSIVHTKSIIKQATDTYPNLNLSLSAGDMIGIHADQNDVVFHAYGTEIYTPAHAVSFDVYENGVVTTVRLYGLESNLNYMKYADEDEALRIGFRGYGPQNEIKLGFGSEAERDRFMNQLEQARLYGNTFTFDPVYPIVHIGNNIGTDATTTTTTTTIPPLTTTTTSTTTTSTTTTSTTTTTTAAPTTTSTTTTTTSTTSTTTTTTTEAPTEAGLSWKIEVLGYIQEARFTAGLVQDSGEPDIQLVDEIVSNRRNTEIVGTVDRKLLNDDDMWITPIIVSMKDDTYAARIEFYDVTDPNEPILIKSEPDVTDPNAVRYWSYGGAVLENSEYIELGKEYQIVVKLQ